MKWLNNKELINNAKFQKKNIKMIVYKGLIQL